MTSPSGASTHTSGDLLQEWRCDMLPNATLPEIRALATQLATRLKVRYDLEFVGAYFVAHRDGLCYPEMVIGRTPERTLLPWTVEEIRDFSKPLGQALGLTRAYHRGQVVLIRGEEHGGIFVAGNVLQRDVDRLGSELEMFAAWLSQAWTAVGGLRTTLAKKLRVTEPAKWDVVAKEAVAWLKEKADLRVGLATVNFATGTMPWIEGDATGIRSWVGNSRKFLARCANEARPFRYHTRGEATSVNIVSPIARLTDGTVFAYLFCSAAGRESSPFISATDVRFCRWIGDALAESHRMLRQQERTGLVLSALSSPPDELWEVREKVVRGIQRVVVAKCVHVRYCGAEVAATDSVPVKLAQDVESLGLQALHVQGPIYRNVAVDDHHKAMKSALIASGGSEDSLAIACSFARHPGAFHGGQFWAVKTLLDHLAMVESTQGRLAEMDRDNTRVHQKLREEAERIELAQEAIQYVHFAKARVQQLGEAVNRASAKITRVRNEGIRVGLRSDVTQAQRELHGLLRAVEGIRLRTPEDITMVNARDIVRQVTSRPVTKPDGLSVMPTGRLTPDAYVVAPKRTLAFIIENLIRNAVESNARSVIVSVETVTHGDLEHIRFSVSDNGEQIPRQVREKMWSSTFTSKEKGSGLGLADTRAFAEKHGGRVGFEHDPVWKTFWLELPRQRHEREQL